MISLKPFKQTRGYCGPASLKMVLAAYGIRHSEEYLARLANASRDRGCYEVDLVKAANALGFDAYIKRKATITDIKKLEKRNIPVIVNWFSPKKAGHYSVVIGFERNNILIADPHFGKVMKHAIDWFKERWFDIIDSQLVMRQMIVVKKAQTFK